MRQAQGCGAQADVLHSSDGPSVIVSSFVQVLVWIADYRPKKGSRRVDQELTGWPLLPMAQIQPLRLSTTTLISVYPASANSFSWSSTLKFEEPRDRKSTRLNSSHQIISYAVFCLKKKKNRTPARSHLPSQRPISYK